MSLLKKTHLRNSSKTCEICHNSFLGYSPNSPFSLQNKKNKIKTSILEKASWEDFKCRKKSICNFAWN